MYAYTDMMYDIRYAVVWLAVGKGERQLGNSTNAWVYFIVNTRTHTHPHRNAIKNVARMHTIYLKESYMVHTSDSNSIDDGRQ